VRISLLTEKYPPVVGGGETHLHQLATGLAERGHSITVMTEPHDGEDVEGYRSADVQFVPVPGLADACRTLSCYAAIPSLVEALREVEGSDVIHVFNHVPAMLCSWLRHELPRPLCVSLFETLVPGVRVFDLWRRFDVEVAVQRALVGNLAPDRVVCGSRAYWRWALAAGFDERILRVVPFGTDIAAFSRGRESRARARVELGWDGSFVYLVPARPVPRKRLEHAVRAFAAVLREHPEVRLVLTLPTDRSELSYVDKLQTEIAALGISGAIDWVRGRGWRDMPELFGASDAVVLPSSHEGFGIALIEAMAARVPVITSDIEGHDEIVSRGETGWLFPPGDIDALRAAMVEVMGSGPSRTTVAAAELVKESFSLEAMVRGHEQVYAEVAGE